MKATKEDYKSVIFSGCSIDCKGVHICNLSNHHKRLVSNNEYQVWSDRNKEYHLFKNIDEAVNKFLELTNTKRRV